MTHVPTDAIPGGLPTALARAALDDAGGYLHLDVDVLDPSVRRANYLPGRVPRRLHRAGAMLTEISP